VVMRSTTSREGTTNSIRMSTEYTSTLCMRLSWITSTRIFGGED
jgi:hypothetical protein